MAQPTILQEVSIKRAKEMLRYYMDKDLPCYFHGAPGVGKSDGAHQVADEAQIGFLDLRLGQMDPVDLLGLPTIIGENTKWARPIYWPDEKRDGKRGIILFDELSDVSRAMQSAAYQIILNRRAGPHILPAGWYPCAAGNRRQDRAGAQSISTALANRFAHVDVGPDLEASVEWMNANDVHPYITSFLRFRPALLHNMEGTDLRAFPTPRSWTRAGLVCDAPVGLRMALVAGLVGQEAAGEFESFIKVYLDLPTLKDIIANPTKTYAPGEDKPAQRYAISGMLSRNAERNNFNALYTYVQRLGREFEIVTMLDASKRDPDLCDTKAFSQFALRNGEINL